MWNFLKGMLFVRATGSGRFVRLLLIAVLVGSIVAGVIYVFVVFRAVEERSSGHHVQHHTAR